MSSPESFAKEQLRSFVTRIEVLEEEKQKVQEEIKDLYAEAKSDGFDVKILKQVVKLRKKEKHEIDAENETLELYLAALDMTDTIV